MGRNREKERDDACCYNEQAKDGKERPQRKTRYCDRNDPENNSEDPFKDKHLPAVHTITSINCWQEEQYNDRCVAFLVLPA